MTGVDLAAAAAAAAETEAAAAAAAVATAESLNESGGADGPALCPTGVATGACPRPECTYLHGDPCPVCLGLCLVPGDPEQNEHHIEECVAATEKKMARDLEIEGATERRSSIELSAPLRERWEAV